MKEPDERIIIRRECKHYDYGQCIAQSGWLGNGEHQYVQCNGNCNRMREYDRAQGYTDKFEIKN